MALSDPNDLVFEPAAGQLRASKLWECLIALLVLAMMWGAVLQTRNQELINIGWGATGFIALLLGHQGYVMVRAGDDAWLRRVGVRLRLGGEGLEMTRGDNPPLLLSWRQIRGVSIHRTNITLTLHDREAQTLVLHHFALSQRNQIYSELRRRVET